MVHARDMAGSNHTQAFPSVKVYGLATISQSPAKLKLGRLLCSDQFEINNINKVSFSCGLKTRQPFHLTLTTIIQL